jgi:hypothetical protein
MAIVTVGIDLAKKVFAVHVVDATGNAVFVISPVCAGSDDYAINSNKPIKYVG